MTSETTLAKPRMPGVHKAAALLMGLGDELSPQILRQLTADEVRDVTAAIANIRTVAPEDMMSVFREFESLTESGKFFAKGGADCARRMVEQAFGSESAEKMLSSILDAEAMKPAMNTIEDAEPRQLAGFLKQEHPQTIAVVLASVSPERAGTLMKSLPDEVQMQVAIRMATLDRISPEAFQKLTEVIGSKLKSMRPVAQKDGPRTLAAVLNHVDAEQSNAILSRLEEQNRPMADSVRSLLFVFEDVLRIDKEGIRALVAASDRAVLTTALKGTRPAIRSHFTQCMSQRAAEMLMEDMEAMGPIRIRDVEAAQRQTIAAIRQLEQAGKISLQGGGDQYVD